MASDAVPESWRPAIEPILTTREARKLGGFLRAEEAAGKRIYPPRGSRLRALELTPLDRVKAVILGQDPYHGPGQAHGLCFSVHDGVKPPPSLVNIFKELHDDVGFQVPRGGNLQPWTAQGVFLLNAILTVEKGKPASHQNKGWETFTDAVIRALSDRREGLVFMLWGRFAQGKAALIDGSRHHILTAPHPSPFSAHSGFFGCRHFSRANALLESGGQGRVDWSLPG